jgi:uncharacterized protein YqeY
MTFEEKINDLIKEAMKAKQKERLEALRAIKSGIILERTKEGASGEITEDTYIKMMQKMVKQRDDSATIYRQQNRPELAEKEEFEATVIREFLPKQMSIQELEDAIKSIIAETGAQGMKDMGKVMGKATAALAGKADGKVVADMVKKVLSA